MNRKFKAIVLIAVILLQNTILAHFTPFSVVPEYTLVVVLAIAAICGDGESVVFAGAAGFALDLLSGAILGLNTLLMIYTTLAFIVFCGFVYDKKIRILSVGAFVLSFLYELLFGLFSILLRGAPFLAQSVVSTVLPVSLVNTLIFIPVYFLLEKVSFEKRRKGIKYEQ